MKGIQRCTKIYKDTGIQNTRRSALLRKDLEVCDSRHFAVLIAHDLAECAGGFEPREEREVDCGLRVPAALEDAPSSRAQREDVARPAKVLRCRRRVRQRAHRGGAIRGGDARGHAHLQVHGDGEGRALGVLVHRHHGPQLERVQSRARERDAHDAGRVPHHKRHRLRGRALRREDQIALVLTVRVVRHQHRATQRDLSDRL